jgi:hypothetical protein
VKTFLAQLEAFFRSNRSVQKKGGLCVALVVNRHAQKQGLPLDASALLTEGKGQVLGLGNPQVQAILKEHGIAKELAAEGGRTSRGSIRTMQNYVAVLNQLGKLSAAELGEVEAWWIGKVKAHFSSLGPKFRFDSGKSVQANVSELLRQARNSETSGAHRLGALLQHLVGAKLDLVLGTEKVEHHGYPWPTPHPVAMATSKSIPW